MADVSSIKLPNNSTYDIKDTIARTKIGNMADKLVYPVIGTQTAATAQFTGTIDVDQLYDGLTIAYYLPYAGVSGTNATLNLTLSDGTTTGAIDVYETGTTRLTTQYAAGSTIILTYWSAGAISVSGTATTSARWTHADYNTDANSIGYQLRHNSGTYTAFANIYRYMLLLSKSSTQVLPVNSVSNSIATTKALTTESFNPFGEILYYSGTSTVSTGSQTTSSLWQQYAFDLRYSFNCGQTLTSNKDVYIVAVPQSDGYAKLASSPLSQDLPTTDDGKIYIYLGHAYSTYQIEMHMNHPVYWYKDGKICLYTKNDVYVAGDDITLTSTTGNNEIKIAAMLQKYWKTSISKTPYSNELEVSTTFSSTISNSSTDPHPGTTDQIELVGASVAGKTYTVDDEAVVAEMGAEVFNIYSGEGENVATGLFSHAEGYNTKAYGGASHAEGMATVASGGFSHSEGRKNISSGEASHAEGGFSVASGICSHAEGNSTIAASPGQHAQGRYNLQDSSGTYAFIIGNGNNESERSNAFAIDWNGNVYVNNATIGVDINALARTANAAAPRSTTYTKTEVDTALAAKLNTADVDNTLSSTSTNPIQNKAVQAPIARLIDAGAKNLLKITGTSQTIRNVTFTVNDDGTVTVNGTNNTTSTAVFYLNILPADTAPNYNGCRLTGCPQGGSTSTYRLAVQLNSGAYTTYASDTGNGGTIHNVPSSDCRVGIFIYAGAAADNLIFKPMICTAEDYAISSEYVPYAKSNYQLTKDARSIPKLVDDGTKNIFKLRDPVTISKNGITFVINNDGTIDLSTDNNGATAQTDISIGEITTKSGVNYVWSGCPSGGSSTTYRLMISTSVYDEGNGYAYTSLVNQTSSPFIRVYKGAVITSPVKFYPMFCTAEDYVISQEFVPYAPNNRELYEEMLPFLSGRKVYEHYFGSSSGSDTFTISKSDFGSGNLSNCGIYLIYRISWSFTPAISIYALAYSGNRADYTTLQKIAGEDFDISVAQDVLSFTTAGKIQIIAVS